MKVKLIGMGIVGLLIASLTLSGCTMHGSGEVCNIELSNLVLIIDGYGTMGNESIQLLMSGSYNVVTIGESVNLSHIHFWGQSNVIYLSRNHSYTVETLGNNIIQYYD